MRGESNNRKFKVAEGKKKKQINGDIRAAKEINAQLNFQNVPATSVRQIYKNVGAQNQTPTSSASNDVNIQNGIMEGVKKPAIKS